MKEGGSAKPPDNKRDKEVEFQSEKKKKYRGRKAKWNEKVKEVKFFG